MNELYVKIKTAQKQYRIAAIREKNHRAKVKASVLSTLLGDIDTKHKRGDEVSEVGIVKLLKKYINDINTTLQIKSDVDLETQKEELNVHIPRQMSDLELTLAIEGIIGEIANPSMGDLGKIMSTLKNSFDGKYNGGVASKLARDILTKKL